MSDANAYNENELLMQLHSGDQEAFAKIYLHYHDGLFNFLLKFTKNPAQTQDFVHDIFLKIWEKRETIDIKTSFAAYLYRFARNYATNHLKHLAVDAKYLKETLHRIELGIHEESQINKLQWQQYQSLLQDALATLTPSKKRAFELIRTQGMSYAEAADEMGISRNTLKEHLVLAVKAIKQYLLTHGDVALMLLLSLLLDNSALNNTNF